MKVTSHKKFLNPQQNNQFLILVDRKLLVNPFTQLPFRWNGSLFVVIGSSDRFSDSFCKESTF